MLADANNAMCNLQSFIFRLLHSSQKFRPRRPIRLALASVSMAASAAVITLFIDMFIKCNKCLGSCESVEAKRNRKWGLKMDWEYISILGHNHILSL